MLHGIRIGFSFLTKGSFMRILLAPEGTEGDLRPILALAIALKNRSHDILTCVPPDFLEYFRKYGITAFPMSIPVKDFLSLHSSTMMGKTATVMIPMIRQFRQIVQDQFNTVDQYGRSVDLIIGAGLQFAASSVSERYSIPYFHIAHVPVIAPSGHYPPAITSRMNLPRFANRLLWLLYRTLLNQLLLRSINTFRGTCNLSPATDISSFFLHNMILAMDKEIVTWPSDIAPVPRQSSYLQLIEQQKLPDDLNLFLHSGDAPVYIGFGSMTDSSPQTTLKIILEAVQNANVRAVISSGWAGISATDRTIKNVFFTTHVPHLQLLPFVKCAVHHGGAGTMHCCCHCGIPQVIIPHMLDQYFWGNRVHRLGLGPKPINRKSLTAKKLAEAITIATTSPLLQRCAKKMSESIRNNAGTDEIINLITAT
jgi:UDP:flavonoid glycosyltransferase YjiC (YdhE family)